MSKDDLVTACELRKVGIPIPDSVPDFATIPRSAVVVSPGKFTPDGSIGVNVDTYVTFTEPFRHIELSVIVEVSKTNTACEGKNN